MPIPPDPELHEELLAFMWGLDSQGRIQLDPKDEVRARLRRSPDLADTAFMLAYELHSHRAGTSIPADASLGSEALVQPSQWNLMAFDIDEPLPCEGVLYTERPSPEERKRRREGDGGPSLGLDDLVQRNPWDPW